MKKLIAAAAMAACVVHVGTAQAQSSERDAERQRERELGSLYLRCDGQPNNMTDGESFARLIGAITLLGIFAPAEETPDPSKRLFGEAGVDACSQLLEPGERAEGNAVRRVPLLLARAAHQIEAKNYTAAIADVGLARQEAAAAGLVGNPYFDRSMGLSFNNIESAALLRMGEPARARDVSLSSIANMRYSYVPSIYAEDYSEYLRDFSESAEIRHSVSARLNASSIWEYASRLEEVGRFAEAARQREAIISINEGISGETEPTLPYAHAAVAHALAGNWERARERASFAQTNLDQRSASGQPDENASGAVELLDLFMILDMAQSGNMDGARRMYSSRSRWTTPSFGVVLEANRRLREGAPEADLIGALAKSADTLWQERYDQLLAVELQEDTENDELFDMIVPYAKVDEFEDRARNTWRVDRSRMMSDEADEDGHWRVFATGSIQSAIDSIVLHSALQARHQGKEGFTFMLNLQRDSYYGVITAGWVRFVNRGEDQADDALFISADEVIAELSQVIPTPEDVRTRREAARRASRNRD